MENPLLLISTWRTISVSYECLTAGAIYPHTVEVQLTTPMFELKVIPSRTRTYTSKKAVWIDWCANKDFFIADVSSPWDGKPVNKQDVLVSDIACVWVRYGKHLEKICSINVIKDRMN